MDFTIAGNQMQMPVIRMVSAQAELTGHGTGQFINSSLDHNLTLVVGPEIAGRIPAAIQKNLTEQPDGRRALHFHVGGTYNAPKLKLIEAR
jgi:hypothetical protein